VKTHDIDVTVENHGTIALLRPHTEAADAWFADHIGDDAQWFGNALAVEPRFVGDIIDGLADDGLAVG
jgi:hypothetical protein